jgi:tRNA dimethylallyltransferase
MEKKCIVVAGPTAVGKTLLAIELAKHFHSSIVSADSRQCYKEMNIGVAKPNAEQLQAVKHYFINSHSVTDELSAADYEQYAIQALEEIFAQNSIAIVVGGTGLYIKALCEGFDAIPAIDPGIRHSIITGYEKKGMEWLRQQLEEKDPEYAQSGEMENPQRMMRALEVVNATGKSIRFFQRGNKAQRNFDILKIGLELPREILYDRINRRVDEMMAEGLLEEVKSLYPFRSLNALQTVGYKELFEYIDGKLTLEQAIGLIKQNTRHYAKRQITWFTKAGIEQFFDPRQTNVILNYVEEYLRRR